MTELRLRQLGLGFFVLAVAVTLGTLVVTLKAPASVPAQYQAGQSGLFFVLASFTADGVGLLIARKQPRNCIGWMLLGIGICIPLGVSNQYVIDAHYAPQSFPAPEVVALLGNAAWYLALALLLSIFLVFPDGKLLSRRWRWFARLAVAVTSMGESGSRDRWCRHSP